MESSSRGELTPYSLLEFHRKIGEGFALNDRKLDESERFRLWTELMTQLTRGPMFSFEYSTVNLAKPLKVGVVMRRCRELIEPLLAPVVFLDVSMAIEEIVANILEHSYGPGETGDIDFRFAFAPNKVSIEIDDFGENGRGYDPAVAGDFSTLEELLQEGAKQRGGMGVYLVKRIMNEVSYEVIAWRINRTRMTKHLK